MIYVDDGFVEGEWGRWNGGGHMLGTDIDELHAFATRIGLRRAWFQDKRYPHYDLTAGRRQRALSAGATPIGAGEFPDDVLMRLKDGTYEPRHVLMARRAAEKAAVDA